MGPAVACRMGQVADLQQVLEAVSLQGQEAAYRLVQEGVCLWGQATMIHGTDLQATKL